MITDSPNMCKPHDLPEPCNLCEISRLRSELAAERSHCEQLEKFRESDKKELAECKRERNKLAERKYDILRDGEDEFESRCD